MGLLNEQFVKFKANDKIYTLQLTDNSNMECSVVVDGKRYYVATKEEVLNNLAPNQKYTDTVEIYYKANEKLIQLGVQENIYTPHIINSTIQYTYNNREDFEYTGVFFFDECVTVNPQDSNTNTRIMLCDNVVHWSVTNAELMDEGDKRFIVTSTNRAPINVVLQGGASDNFITSNVLIPLHGEQRFMVYATETEIIH